MLSSSSTPVVKQGRRFLPQLAQFLFIATAAVLSLHATILLRPSTVSEQRLDTRAETGVEIPPVVPTSNSTPTTPSLPTVRPRVVRALFYLKLHKTGSSTIAHHLFSFTRAKKLSTLRAPANLYITKPNPTPYKCDAIVGHHFAFNLAVVMSYLKRKPDLVLTSIRLPLQRQVSWFQQQNRNIGSVSCDGRNDTLLSHFDEWYPKRMAPQYKQLQEAGSREALGDDVEKIIDQFDFVFVKERLRESFECFCEKTGIRLCSKQVPLASKNVRGGSCVEKQLLTYRSEALLRGAERDLLIYEAVGRRLGCRASEWCRCFVSG